MSIERELLKRFMTELTTEEDVVSLFNDIKECLAKPEQKPEEDVYQKLLRIEDGVEVEILPSELWQDGYEAGKRSVLLSKQPEQHGTQYLLDQVARLTAENAMLKEKWSTSKQPEQNKAGAIMPNGVRVTNVYDAYEEGRKSVMGEQEPVAWMWEDKRNGSNSWATVVSNAKPEKCEYHVRNIRPLYLASPKRESLSTDTMLRLITEHRDFPLNLARAVERECGIGDWNE